MGELVLEPPEGQNPNKKVALADRGGLVIIIWHHTCKYFLRIVINFNFLIQKQHEADSSSSINHFHRPALAVEGRQY